MRVWRKWDRHQSPKANAIATDASVKNEGRWTPLRRVLDRRNVMPDFRSIKGLACGVSPCLSTTTFKNSRFSKMAMETLMCCLASTWKYTTVTECLSVRADSSCKIQLNSFDSKCCTSIVWSVLAASKQNRCDVCNMIVLVPASCVKTLGASLHEFQKTMTWVACWVCWHINNTRAALLPSSTTSLF